MIGWLQGTILEKSTESMILDVGGVGYELMLPLSSLAVLPQVAGSCRLWVYTHVREDALKLFGFADPFDRKVFECLISVTNVGPKLALALLGPLNGKDVVDVISTSRTDILVQIPGVGARTAERLIVELKDKVIKLRERYQSQPAQPKSPAVDWPARVGATTQPQLFQETPSPNSHQVIWEDVQGALVNLGYKDKHIQDVLKKLKEQERQGTQFSLEEALRASLKALSSAAGFTRKVTEGDRNHV